MFDRVADEDVRDARDNGGGEAGGDEDGGGGGDDGGDNGGVPSSAARAASRKASDSEPPAVKQIRELVEAVRGDVAVSVELELLAEKLRSMGGGVVGAGGDCCGPELWRRVR